MHQPGLRDKFVSLLPRDTADAAHCRLIFAACGKRCGTVRSIVAFCYGTDSGGSDRRHRRSTLMRKVLLIIGCCPLWLCAAGTTALASNAVAAPRSWSAELALGMGQPAALQTGVALGPALVWHSEIARAGRWGLGAGGHAGWRSATEYSRSYAVRHDEARAGALLELARQHPGGAVFARWSAGAALVWEARDRHQAGRLGADAATALRTETLAAVPTTAAELGLAVQLWPSWSLALAVGPAAHWRDSGLAVGAGGWMGVQWQP